MNTARSLSKKHINGGLCIIINNFKHDIAAAENNFNDGTKQLLVMK
jgi:hypothetical protein